jgi:hypothetical protein
MIAKNSHDYRPLGLGYANLLMAFGLPYDSDAGRDFAATLTVSPPSAPASPTSSASPDTRATSPSASTPTASRRQNDMLSWNEGRSTTIGVCRTCGQPLPQNH